MSSSPNHQKKQSLELCSLSGGSRAKPQKFTLHRNHYDHSILIYGIKWNNPWKSDCTGRALSFLLVWMKTRDAEQHRKQDLVVSSQPGLCDKHGPSPAEDTGDNRCKAKGKSTGTGQETTGAQSTARKRSPGLKPRTKKAGFNQQPIFQARFKTLTSKKWNIRRDSKSQTKHNGHEAQEGLERAGNAPEPRRD